MSRLLLYTCIIVSLACCRHSPSSIQQVKQPTLKDTFQYKELLEDYVSSFSQKDISRLFGKWTIKEIAKVGGTMQDEQRIRNQIGNQLYIDSFKVVFDFLGDTTIIKKPSYRLRVLTDETAKGNDLKGTSYFEGYRTDRDKVFELIVSNKLYFEIIHFTEMTTYDDGRIYFLRKND